MADVVEIRVLVTGAAEHTDPDIVGRSLAHLGANYIFGARPEEIVVVHGDETATDKLAAEAAAWLGWRSEGHRADHEREGDAAGIIRDREMVLLGAHYCLAFLGDEASARRRRLALNAGIPVIDIHEGGNR